MRSRRWSHRRRPRGLVPVVPGSTIGYVVRQASTFVSTPCWLWTGARDVEGYALYTSAGRTMTGHKFYWIRATGRRRVPRGKHLDHVCRVRHCVNPAHLEVVTPMTNVRRSSVVVLTGNEPTEIIAAYRAGQQPGRRPVRMLDLARRYRVSVATICNVINRRHWRTRGGKAA